MILHEKLEIAHEIAHAFLSTHISFPATLNNVGLTEASFWKKV